MSRARVDDWLKLLSDRKGMGFRGDAHLPAEPLYRGVTASVGGKEVNDLPRSSHGHVEGMRA